MQSRHRLVSMRPTVPRASAPRRVSAAILLLVGAVTASPAVGAPVVDEEFLALELSDALFPPPALVDRIASDLAACWALVPLLEDVHVFPIWTPGVVYARVSDDVDQEALDALNTLLHIDEISEGYYGTVTFSSEEPFHSVIAAGLYEAIPGVYDAYAEDWVGDGHDIDVLEDGLYRFEYAWGDCPAGCIHSHYWEIRVEDGVATLVAEYGDPITTPVRGVSWGEVKTRFGR